MEKKYTRVGSTENTTSNNPAKYLARIICRSVSGRVSNSSMVPDFFSSENNRIVMAGMRNIKTQGAMINSVLMLA